MRSSLDAIRKRLGAERHAEIALLLDDGNNSASYPLHANPPFLKIPTAVWRVILAFSLLRLVLAFILPLTPQEAYYWSWSRTPALSYFDHPPLASYTIWLTSFIFGQTVFGIKLAAVGWFLLLNIIWARMVQEMFGNTVQSRWTLLALNAGIVFELYGFVITPDTPLMVFWSATLYAVWKVVQTGEAKYWYLAGLFLGLSWLGKYTGILLVPSIFLFLIFSRLEGVS
jgi:4-amino-4-deoxy-L-arabinose transferase-like glycosyltransferase